MCVRLHVVSPLCRFKREVVLSSMYLAAAQICMFGKAITNCMYGLSVPSFTDTMCSSQRINNTSHVFVQHTVAVLWRECCGCEGGHRPCRLFPPAADSALAVALAGILWPLRGAAVPASTCPRLPPAAIYIYLIASRIPPSPLAC